MRVQLSKFNWNLIKTNIDKRLFTKRPMLYFIGE